MGDVVITVTKKMYSWSKYGGSGGAVKENLQDEWYCQFCGAKQVKSLPCYLIATDESERDFLRACSLCKRKSLVVKTTTYEELLNEARK